MVFVGSFMISRHTLNCTHWYKCVYTKCCYNTNFFSKLLLISFCFIFCGPILVHFQCLSNVSYLNLEGGCTSKFEKRRILLKTEFNSTVSPPNVTLLW